MDFQDVMQEISIFFKGKTIRSVNALNFYVEATQPVQVIVDKWACDQLQYITVEQFRDLIRQMIDSGKLYRPTNCNEASLHFSDFIIANFIAEITIMKAGE